MKRIADETAHLEVTPDMWGAALAAPREAAERGVWFAEARYALFIHWGLYSALAGRWRGTDYHGIGEWLQHRARIPAAEYAETARAFNPTAFDARAWVQLARDAGMRYIVLTAKHHDGFALFRSAASPFNIVEGTPFARDPIAELAEACRAAGMRLGFYYSQTQDWHEPDAIGNTWDVVEGRDFRRYLQAKAIPQIEELLTQYGDVALIWFDTPGPITAEDSHALQEKIRRLQPHCLINSRIGNGLGDYETLGDQEIPRLARGGLWETIDTHNDTWGYVAFDHNWKSPREVAARLIRVVARGGNYMLNVGPDGLGRIPEPSAQILRTVGRWLQGCGEAIYGAGASPLGPLPWGECTAREASLYLHVFDWPADGQLVVPGTFSGVRALRLLGDERTLTHEDHGDHLLIHLPPVPPATLIPVIALAVEGVAAPAARVVLHGHVNRLDALEAVATGTRPSTRSWMEKFGDWKHAECLLDWEPDHAAAWSFRTLAPGTFYVEVDYSSPAEDGECIWRLSLGAREITFPLPATGEYRIREGNVHAARARFTTYRVGLVHLPAGPHTLTLTALTAACAPTSLTAVTLVPLE